MPANHDAAYKFWHEFAAVVEHLLLGFAPPGVAAALDLATLEPMSTEYVDRDLRQSRGDKVWRVRFRGGGAGDCLWLAVMLEFQATVDPRMGARVLAYSGQLFQKRIRAGDFCGDGKLPPVLPIVVYNGRRRWSAPLDAFATISGVSEALAPFQPRQRYLLLDMHGLRVEDLPRDNIVSAQIALEQGSPPHVAAAVGSLARLLAGPEHDELRRVVADWVSRLFARDRMQGDARFAAAFEAARLAGDLGAMEIAVENFNAWYDRRERLIREGERRIREGVQRIREDEQRIREGQQRIREDEQRIRERGLERERALLLRQAALKFDGETGARLAGLLDGVADPERLGRIAELVIRCGDGEDFLAQAAEAGAANGSAP